MGRENLYATRSSSFQQRFSIHVWAGIIDDYLTGPYVAASHLSISLYKDLLERILPLLMDNVPLNVCDGAWLQHDSNPLYFSCQVCSLLNNYFPETRSGCGGPTVWPVRSSDLSPLRIFSCGNASKTTFMLQSTRS
jgi:hypothetical protein